MGKRLVKCRPLLHKGKICIQPKSFRPTKEAVARSKDGAQRPPQNPPMLNWKPSPPPERPDLLALSLARLATLQGHALSWHDFSRQALNLDVMPLASIPLSSRAAALWSTQFPQAAIYAPDWPPQPWDLPALWLGPRPPSSQDPLYLAHGSMPNGGLCCLDEWGRSLVLPASVACQGKLLALRSHQPLSPR
jgi:hypothetical protein